MFKVLHDEEKISKEETVSENSVINAYERIERRKKQEELKEYLKKRRDFYDQFMSLKKSLGISTNVRKGQIDSFLKKTKSKLFKSIHQSIKKCVYLKLKKIPQSLITNIKIDFNKNLMEKTIMSLYVQNKVFLSYDFLKHNGFIVDGKDEILKKLLDLTVKEAYENYLESKLFIKDCGSIAAKEGKSFAVLFEFVSKIFTQYYQINKGNRAKLNLKPKEELKHKEKPQVLKLFKTETKK